MAALMPSDKSKATHDNCCMATEAKQRTGTAAQERRKFSASKRIGNGYFRKAAIEAPLFLSFRVLQILLSFSLLFFNLPTLELSPSLYSGSTQSSSGGDDEFDSRPPAADGDPLAFLQPFTQLCLLLQPPTTTPPCRCRLSSTGFSPQLPCWNLPRRILVPYQMQIPPTILILFGLGQN
ncbi:uncharacterized protein LOC127809622 [Diospyros lotus]|uniref:uncharacterized protein LOC127809622 n=1 Tax=Diospyros lotus TaxID=55363 RepID=UPI0022523CEE|nr:uncharacterized protein LOC127809622 [Diospyros lotus]XP_052204523.1 uncharacterized protein LOC127809622 [Diospyros lotus]XP_052204524.1 uncharacterized protein LOC127809622 [Diospyros lotus]